MARAERLFPGGVNSPVRAFRAVGGTPRVIDRALGALVWDVDGNELIDYIGSWGPMILGHAHPAVVAAITEAAARGTSYGAPNPREVELAEQIIDAMPSVERLRFVSSGTEAAMSAIRLARAATGRDAIIKLAGGYHGHADALLVQPARAPSACRPAPGSPPAPRATRWSRRYNDLDAVERLLAAARGRGRDRRAGRRQHGRRPAGAGLPRGPARPDQPAWRAAHLRRGDHRLPRRPRRRDRRATASRPT